eukprot:COSAG04_NODE_246_length_18912_cov_7.669537_9_plen_164_part_00
MRPASSAPAAASGRAAAGYAALRQPRGGDQITPRDQIRQMGGAQLSCWLISAAYCAGTFMTPSLAEAVELRDPLLFGALLALALVFGPGMLPILAEARRVCRCTGEEALLPRLGAGTALLSAERRSGLEKWANMVDPNSRYSWVGRASWGGLTGFFVDVQRGG